MTVELIVTVAASSIAFLISSVSLYLSRQDKYREHMDLLNDKINVISIENQVFQERLNNSIERTKEISEKLDLILESYVK